MSASIAQELILGMKVSATSYLHATTTICEWVERRESKYVCIAPVSSVMEAYDSEQFRCVLNDADLVTPDGMAVVWGLKLMGQRHASRVYGPDLTKVLLEHAASAGFSVGFYGGTPAVIERLIEVVQTCFPNLKIVFAWSPPFRPLTADEEREAITVINRAAPQILFVGIGSPKQEFWMAAHRGKIQAVMLGVGAAFDFLSGAKPQAPRWMMGAGMEWLFRLATEPRRLWKRYLKQNPRFIVLFAQQLLGVKFGRATAAQSGA